MSVAAVALTYGEVGGELAFHVYPKDIVRISAWGFGTADVGRCGCGHLAGYVGAELALRRADDVSIRLGASFGPMVFLHGTVDAGASALLSLDVALPITRKVAFDVVLRGGFDVANVPSYHPAPPPPNSMTGQDVWAPDNPPTLLEAQPFLYAGLGITWDFNTHAR